jgi:hypothetical protein
MHAKQTWICVPAVQKSVLYWEQGLGTAVLPAGRLLALGQVAHRQQLQQLTLMITSAVSCRVSCDIHRWLRSHTARTPVGVNLWYTLW